MKGGAYFEGGPLDGVWQDMELRPDYRVCELSPVTVSEWTAFNVLLSEPPPVFTYFRMGRWGKDGPIVYRLAHGGGQ